MKKLFLPLAGALCVGLFTTGCATNLDKLSWLKDDPAEVHLVIDRNGLKLDRTNTGAITNRVVAQELQENARKALRALEGK